MYVFCKFLNSVYSTFWLINSQEKPVRILEILLFLLPKYYNLIYRISEFLTTYGD